MPLFRGIRPCPPVVLLNRVPIAPERDMYRPRGGAGVVTEIGHARHNTRWDLLGSSEAATGSARWRTGLHQDPVFLRLGSKRRRSQDADGGLFERRGIGS